MGAMKNAGWERMPGSIGESMETSIMTRNTVWRPCEILWKIVRRGISPL